MKYLLPLFNNTPTETVELGNPTPKKDIDTSLEIIPGIIKDNSVITIANK